MNNEMFLFRKNALLNNLCKEWSDMWKACNDNKERLFKLVLMQQSLPFFADYCYRGKGLSKEYIAENFGDFTNGAYTGIDVDGVKGNYKTQLYSDFKGTIECNVDVLSIMYCDDVGLSIPQRKCPKIYISNKSVVHLSADGYNYITVLLFDESELVIEDNHENTDVLVSQSSDQCKVTKGKYCLGKVNEFEKTLRL